MHQGAYTEERETSLQGSEAHYGPQRVLHDWAEPSDDSLFEPPVPRLRGEHARAQFLLLDNEGAAL